MLSHNIAMVVSYLHIEPKNKKNKVLQNTVLVTIFECFNYKTEKYGDF